MPRGFQHAGQDATPGIPRAIGLYHFPAGPKKGCGFGLWLSPLVRPLVLQTHESVRQMLHAEMAAGPTRWPEVNHLAFTQYQQGVRLGDIVEVVGDTQHQLTLPGGPGQHLHDPGFRGRIQAASRLVHQQNRRINHQFRGEFNPLAFPSRK